MYEMQMSSLKDSSSFVADKDKPNTDYVPRLEKFFKANMPRTGKNNTYVERLQLDDSK